MVFFSKCFRVGDFLQFWRFQWYLPEEGASPARAPETLPKNACISSAVWTNTCLFLVRRMNLVQQESFTVTAFWFVSFLTGVFWLFLFVFLDQVWSQLWFEHGQEFIPYWWLKGRQSRLLVISVRRQITEAWVYLSFLSVFCLFDLGMRISSTFEMWIQKSYKMRRDVL